VKFWIPWSVDAAVAAVVMGFYLVGLGDGSVSSYNAMLWLGVLAALAVVVGGSLVLKIVGRRALAIALGLVLTIPAALFCLFWVVVIVSHPRWN
jgi:hypothetical protein